MVKLPVMGKLFMKRNERAKEWLKRARSNLARAKLGAVSSDILLIMNR